MENITPSELAFEQLLENCGDYIIENLNKSYCPDSDVLQHSATLDDVNQAFAGQQAVINQCSKAAGKKAQSSIDGQGSDSVEDENQEGAIDGAQCAVVAADDDTRKLWSLMTGLHGDVAGNDSAVGIKDLIIVISQESDEVKKIDWFDKLTSSVLKSIMSRYSIPFDKEDKTAGSLLFHFTRDTDILSAGDISAERKAGIDLCVDVSKHIVQSIFCESCPDVSLRSYIWDIIGEKKCKIITGNPKLRDPRTISNVVSSGSCGALTGICRVGGAVTGVLVGTQTYSSVNMFGVRAPGQHSRDEFTTSRSSAAPGHN